MKVRFLVAMLAVVGLVIVTQPRDAQAYSGEIFEIKGSGTLFHLENRAAGQKPFLTGINATVIVNCITNLTADCVGVIDQNAQGKAYICFESDTVFSISTDVTFATRTSLEGLAGGTGTFAMAGQHAASDTLFSIKGKVRLAAGTLNPLGIPKLTPATILAVSDTNEHYATGKFWTVGGSLGTCP